MKVEAIKEGMVLILQYVTLDFFLSSEATQELQEQAI